MLAEVAARWVGGDVKYQSKDVSAGKGSDGQRRQIGGGGLNLEEGFFGDSAVR